MRHIVPVWMNSEHRVACPTWALLFSHYILCLKKKIQTKIDLEFPLIRNLIKLMEN